MTDDTHKPRPIHLCPGSLNLISRTATGGGVIECLDCKHPVRLLSDGRQCVHQRQLDRHEPCFDDGVLYCGWANEVGVFDGCGKLWPCGGGS